MSAIFSARPKYEIEHGLLVEIRTFYDGTSEHFPIALLFASRHDQLMVRGG
jgi:hypothetical protein